MKVVFLIIAFLVLGFFSVRFLERKNLYFPLHIIGANPGDINLNYEEISFNTKDGISLAGWFIPSETSRATLIFCHGNAGNISHRLDKIKLFHELDLDVLIFDYRGYGLSKGKPSENGLYIDAEAVYDYLVTEKAVPPQKIIAYGESLGGAIAIDLAGRHKLAGVIVEGCFTSISDVAKQIFPFIPAFVYKAKFNALKKIKNIKAHKLIFHSIDDRIVPFKLGEKLFNAAADPKELVKLQGGHNDAFFISRNVFISKIDEFVKKTAE